MGYGISTLPYTNHTRGLAGPQLARPVRAPPPLSPELVPPIKQRWDKLPSNTSWLDEGHQFGSFVSNQLVSSTISGEEGGGGGDWSS